MNVLWFVGLLGSYLLYKNFFPTVVKCISPDLIESNEETLIVDLRDYHIAAKFPIKEAFVLPFAYLKRYHKQLKGKKLYVVAPDTVVRNLSIRFLKGKGYEVLGYCIVECQDKMKRCS
jgi:hypothetical protein